MTNITDIGTNIDYAYPSMNRKDLMSLSTVNSNDALTRKFKQVDTKRDWTTNLYNLDIDGSVPKRFGVFNHKTDFINKLDDIERTNPKLLHVKLDKKEYNLTNADIDGSSPQCVKFKTSRQSFNPLEPKYNLSKVEQLIPQIPKFIRDNIDIADIDGAHPKKYFKWETRSGMFDVPDSKSKKQYVRNTKYSNFDYSDVTHDVFKTKRCVDPLDPVYEVKYKGGENYIHGHIEGNKSVTFNPFIYADPKNMKLIDIDGTQVGSKNKINKFTGQNYNLQLGDIRGANSGSLKKGIETVRNTNPLNPKYINPGEVELAKNQNPFGNTLFAKSSKVRQDSGKEIVGGNIKPITDR